MTLDYLNRLRDKAKLLKQMETSYGALLYHTAPMDNMPHGKGGVSDPVSRTAALRVERQAEMESVRREIDHMYTNVRAWLDNEVHDAVMEAYILLHFVDGYSYEEVGSIMGRKKGSSTVRNTVSAYLLAHSSDTYTD